ncbi:MAG TPA: PaaI family thioesterase [Bacteroidota bacterium]|nr:PaaI family thioesterase [Bacteroidota bacterium]
MHHHVTGKQQNSKMCFVCGLKNSFGLAGSFYELDNKELVCIFTASERHQSYPGRLHGGITTAVLDETIGRAIMMHYEEMLWGVTVEFTTKFRKPIPLGVELRVVGRITSDTSRFFEGTGELLLPDGEVAATGSGKYIKMPLAKIADFNAEEQEWRVVQTERDPQTIEFGDH